MTEPVYEAALYMNSSWQNVTADAVGINFARAVGTLFNPLQPGEMTLELDNWAGDYSPANSAGPWHGELRPGIGARLRATYNSSTYSLFDGRVSRISIAPQMADQRRAVMAIRDAVADLQAVTITTSIFVASNIGSVAAAVFAASGVASYAIDTLYDTSPFAWFEGRDGLNALREVVDAGYYNAYVDGAGVFNLRGRYWDQQGIASLAGSYAEFYDLGYELSDDDVRNAVQIRGVPRAASSQATVAFFANVPSIAASSGIGFFLQYLDPDNGEPAPARNLVTPVNSLDYVTNTATDGSGTDRTATASVSITFFGASAVASVFNGSADTVYLTRFVIRGESLQRRAEVSVMSEDASSQAFYAERSLDMTNDLLAERNYLKDYADFLINRNKEPQPAPTMALKSQWPDILDLTLGDVVHATEAVTGIDQRFTIIGVAHQISPDRGFEHIATYTLDGVREQSVLILDDPVYGVLDGTRKLGF